MKVTVNGRKIKITPRKKQTPLATTNKKEKRTGVKREIST